MKNLCEKFGCLVTFQQLYSMEKNPTCEKLLAENQNLRHRIMMLERMLFSNKKDRLKPNVFDDQPGLFDDFFQEAVAEKEYINERIKER